MKIKKKIAFFTPLYLPANLSGSAVVVRDIAEQLAQEGYDVSIITSNALTARYWYDPIFGKRIKKRQEIVNGIKVYRLSCNQVFSSFLFIVVRYINFLLPNKYLQRLKILYNGPFLIGLKELIEKEKFTIIHCSPFPLAINKQIVDAIDSLSDKPKLILTPFFHSEVDDFYNPELSSIIAKADIIHTVTYIEKKTISKTFHADTSKIKIIPLFLKEEKSIKESQLKDSVHAFKKKYNLDKRKIVLFAGNKGVMKGAVTLLEVMNVLYKEDTSYRLVAIGNDMPEWIATKKRIDTEFLVDLGYVSQKEKEVAFASCDVFCMPSKSESFGLTYLEAWKYGKPVIGADIPTSRELIEENNAGLLVTFNDKNALKNAIIKLCSDKAYARKLGENGSRVLHKNYVFTQFITKFKEILA